MQRVSLTLVYKHSRSRPPTLGEQEPKHFTIVKFGGILDTSIFTNWKCFILKEKIKSSILESFVYKFLKNYHLLESTLFVGLFFLVPYGVNQFFLDWHIPTAKDLTNDSQQLEEVKGQLEESRRQAAQ